MKCDYEYQCLYKLDINKMKDVAKLFKGVHNFHNFVSGIRDNYDCIIYDINFDLTDDLLKIEFRGKSFYRYMVRNLVGALIDIGKNKIDESIILNMLDTEETTKHLRADRSRVAELRV